MVALAGDAPFTAALTTRITNPTVRTLETIGAVDPFIDSTDVLSRIELPPPSRSPFMSDGRIFREAWIAGVNKHYRGEPKPGYVTPWDETPEWEREAAAAVYGQVRDFIRISEGHAARLTREASGLGVRDSRRSMALEPQASGRSWPGGITRPRRRPSCRSARPIRRGLW